MGALIGLGLGGVGAIGGLISSFGNNAKLDELYRQDPSYSGNPIAGQRLGLAQTLLNGRMPGATAMERNIYGNQSNQLANVNRNATDSSQALALGASAQGQTNQALQNLATQEQQDYYNRLNNLTGAQQGMIQEGDKVYQDKLRKYSDLSAITGAKIQNTANAWKSLSNMGFGGASVASQMNLGGNTNISGMSSFSQAGNNYMGMQPIGQGGGYGQSYMPQNINPNGGYGGMMNVGGVYNQ